MRRRTPAVSLLFALLATVAASAPPLRAQGQPPDFLERFALGGDERGAALAQLLPGTEDHYYWHCVHAQHEGRFDEVPPLLRAWIERHGRTPRVATIENRQALLTFDRDPAATFAFLRQRLGADLTHQRQVPGAESELPTTLDPAAVAPSALARRALELHPRTLDGFRDSALAGLATAELDDDLLTSLLQRLRHPDVTNLSALVVRQLASRRGGAFGSLPIHGTLLLSQLEECARQRPALLGDKVFVATWLQRLRPGDDVDWRHDPAAREAYLERLEAFARRLPQSFDSLRAHVLYHRLRHELERPNGPDRDRFLAYLRLPRPNAHVAPEHVRRHGGRTIDPREDWPTGLGPIGDDEAVVRACLEHFFVREDTFEPWTETLRAEYVRRLFAETKILAGQGDMERWYSLLDDPAAYEALQRRVEIAFAPTQSRWYAPDDPVAIEVDVKNVPTLLLRVFRIDALQWFMERGSEVDDSIDVAGLVANEETTHRFDEPPIRRVRRKFDLPSLRGPGTWLVELIGNGVQSRALIRKGRLQLVERPGAAGHVCRVLDERGRHVREASLLFGGREYTADERGEIVLPYSTQPGERQVVLRHGEQAALATFSHRGEQYSLQAAVHVVRESLLPRARANVLVPPALSLHGAPLALHLLQQPVLAITATDVHGVRTTIELRDLELRRDRELVQAMTVPEDLVSLTVTLRGRVQSLITGEPIELASPPVTLAASRIDATAATAAPLLGRTPEGFVLDVLGKDGEPRPGHAITLQLEHRDYVDPLPVTLRTDASGRVHLGALPGIVAVHAPEVGVWRVPRATRTYPDAMHGVAGETLRVPYQGTATSPSREALSLLELRDGQFVRDAFDRLAIDGGFVLLRDLPAGDYDLWLREADVHVAVRVTAGERQGDLAAGAHRVLRLGGAPPLHVTGVRLAGDELVVQLANAGAAARVHVFATRWLPAYDAFAALGGVAFDRQLAVVPLAPPASEYEAGRALGDEQRYVLERRFATKFAGNMLPRPGLVLNRMPVEESAWGLGGGAGGKFGRRGGAGKAAGSMAGAAAAPPPEPSPAAGTFADLAFVAVPAPLAANLRPDAQGVVRVRLADLGAGQQIHVLAADGEHVVYETLLRDEAPLARKSRRLPRALPLERHFVEQRRIEFVAAGGEAVLAGATTVQAETYDSLAAVYRLLRTLRPDDEALRQFEFVLRWPELPAAERRQAYSRHACHELHLFLHQKDPAFFAEVVRPYLESKAHPTFLDEWLLGRDLRRWLEPWAFGRLNVVERILLARRLPDEAAAIARLVREHDELRPRDPAREAMLFDTALGGGALDQQGRLADKLRDLGAGGWHEEKAKSEPTNEPSPPAAAEAPQEQAMDLEEEVAEDARRRSSVRPLWREPAPTRRYVEQNYWQRPITEQDASLITANAFWRDFAEARGGGPFVSPHVAEAAGSFAEAMLALAVLDLPFKAGAHATEGGDAGLTLRAASPLLLVRKQVVAAERVADPTPVLVNQNYYRLDERYRFVGGERRDAWVTGELLASVAYGCQVVVTNPTSQPRHLQLLLQVPQGAVPVLSGFVTRGLEVALGAYGTQAVDYAFYFPAAGAAPHWPVHVAEDGALVAFAPPRTLEVVAAPTHVDATSWEHVSQNGTAEDVLALLKDANVLQLDLSRIAWRMRDRATFDAVLQLLRRRHHYADVLWAYALHHGDAAATGEYLRHADAFLAACGPALESPLVRIDAVERRWWQLVEFEPLHWPRAHRFGGQPRAAGNPQLAAQWRAFLDVLGHRRRLDDADHATATYYLLLQDRVAEALAEFARIDPSRLAMHLQYDYLRAYVAFFTGDVATAREAATRWREHPVEHWRQRFAAVLAQLDEAEGRAPAGGAAVREGDLTASEPSLELDVQGERVQVRWRNLQRCDVRYWRLDLELSFSTSPFLQQVQEGRGAFAFVQPNAHRELTLPRGQDALAFDVPEELHGRNLLVEVRGGGLVRRQLRQASALAVRTIESQGQLEVRHATSGKPLVGVYVKVFARMPDRAGAATFHKDGYTDLRGRFDYASVSGSATRGADRFAILVLSDTDGAVIREVDPPKM